MRCLKKTKVFTYAGLVQGSSRLGLAERDIGPAPAGGRPHRIGSERATRTGGLAPRRHGSPATPRQRQTGQADRIRTGAEAANCGWYKLNQHSCSRLTVCRSDKLRLHTPMLIPHPLMMHERGLIVTTTGHLLHLLFLCFSIGMDASSFFTGHLLHPCRR